VEGKGDAKRATGRGKPEGPKETVGPKLGNCYQTGRRAFLDKSPLFQCIQCKVVFPENSEFTRLDIKQDEKST
jgi:hypothetical protein